MPNVTSIILTGVDSEWYFVDGPLSGDVKYSPWPMIPFMGGVGQLGKSVLSAVWQVRDCPNAARITSFTIGLGYHCSGMNMMDLTHAHNK